MNETIKKKNFYRSEIQHPEKTLVSTIQGS
jgi:hypothetical protein